MDCWALLLDEPIPYAEGLAVQEAVHAARRADRIPDTVLFLQHRPVVTLGRRGREDHLVASRAELARRGVDLVRASRGGDVTYHAPGQWVLYPILRLGAAGADAHGHLWNLEECAIRTAADFGVDAFRRPAMAGAWTAQGKLAAIGFHLRRWVTLHGMSFNVDLDLSGFDWIVPCGLPDRRIASLRSLLGAAGPSLDAARARLLANFGGVFARRPAVFTRDDAPRELAEILARAVQRPGG